MILRFPRQVLTYPYTHLEEQAQLLTHSQLTLQYMVLHHLMTLDDL